MNLAFGFTTVEISIVRKAITALKNTRTVHTFQQLCISGFSNFGIRSLF
jgi:hypothetical protein